MTEVLLAYFHYASIFTLVWFLAKEWTLLKAGAERLDVVRLAKADIGYFIAAIAVVCTGGARLIFGAKPWVFYAHNPVFHAKIGIFILVGIVSIWPTIAFIRWRKAAAADASFRVSESDWRRTKRFVMAELHMVALIPLLAAMMARGIGLQ